MKRYFIKIGNQPLHITEWGSPDLPVIFCLHGLGSTGLSFIEVAEQLKAEFRIIAIDAPGHGKTPPFKYGEEYEMTRMADWLNEAIDQLDVGPFYFLSHSWGSFVALHFTARYPEKVRDNILLDGGYQGKKYSNQTVEEEVAYYEADFEQVWETWEDFLALVKSETLNWTESKLEAAKDLSLYKDQQYYWHARGETAAHIIRAMHKDEPEDIYPKLNSTILLLKATLPQSLEQNRNKTAAIFKEQTGCQVKAVQKVSHLLHWDRPDFVIEEIKNRWK